jgi:hypothetical protein
MNTKRVLLALAASLVLAAGQMSAAMFDKNRAGEVPYITAGLKKSLHDGIENGLGPKENAFVEGWEDAYKDIRKSLQLRPRQKCAFDAALGLPRDKKKCKNIAKI